MRSRSALALALAAVLGTASGCILFVNDGSSSYSSTCTFQGSDTACGKCVAITCAAQLDKCCGDSTCEKQLSWLDTCVSQSDPGSCDVLASTAPALAACLETRCAACPGADGGVGVGADGATGPSCQMLSGYCSCFMGGTPGGIACTPQTVAPGLCCADTAWPGASTSCTCQPFSCSSAPGGASCALGTTSTGLTSYSGGACCAYGTSCYCDDTQSTCTSATQVDSCTVDAISCGYGSYAVTSCSF